MKKTKQVEPRIAAYKKTGRLFAEFINILEASRITGVDVRVIRQVLQGRKKSAMGMMFREIDNENLHILKGSC